MTPLKTLISRFVRNEDAALSIEAAIMLPVLGFIYIAGFGYFDAYRREAVMTKASYAIGDLISREEGTITPVDLEGLQDVFEFLTFSEGETWMRTTEIQRNGDSINVVWSYATDGNQEMTNARLQGYLNQIPTLGNGERVVIVESFSDFEPVFDIGLTDRTFVRFVPTRQRYAAKLDFDPTVVPTQVASVAASPDAVASSQATASAIQNTMASFNYATGSAQSTPGATQTTTGSSQATPASTQTTVAKTQNATPGTQGTPGSSQSIPGTSYTTASGTNGAAGAPGQSSSSGTIPGSSQNTSGTTGTNPTTTQNTVVNSQTAPGTTQNTQGSTQTTPGTTQTTSGTTQTTSGTTTTTPPTVQDVLDALLRE